MVENLVGVMVVGLTFAFMLVFALQDRRDRIALRRIRAMDRLEQDIGMAVENGRRVHVSLGRGQFLDSHAAGTLTGTTVLREVLKRSTGSDRPPAMTSGDGVGTLLGLDLMQSLQGDLFVLEHLDARRGRLAGVTPMSFAAGVLPALESEQTSKFVATGMFGAEISLILDTAEDNSIKILAAPDSAVGQAVAFCYPVDVLVGEEIFAIPAYLRAGHFYTASLMAEDALRWLLIVFIMIGAVLRSIGFPTI